MIFWAPTLEMVLTGCSENGSLLGWDLHPLQQSAKIWLHNAGITHVHELVNIYFLYFECLPYAKLLACGTLVPLSKTWRRAVL